MLSLFSLVSVCVQWYIIYRVFTWWWHRVPPVPVPTPPPPPPIHTPHYTELIAQHHANLAALTRFGLYLQPQGGPGSLADPPVCLVRVGMLAAPWTREQTYVFATGMTLVPSPGECVSARHLWVGQLPWTRVRVEPAAQLPLPPSGRSMVQFTPNKDFIHVRVDEQMRVVALFNKT